MIYLTGDTHADWMSRLSSDVFPEGKDLTKDDYVIILGDFGIWQDGSGEQYRLDWLDEKPFTTLFLDGNHENFDRLYGDEFLAVPFAGGMAQRIRPSVYHLLRGEAYTLEDRIFYVFGGASSHDIRDAPENDFNSITLPEDTKLVAKRKNIYESVCQEFERWDKQKRLTRDFLKDIIEKCENMMNRDGIAEEYIGEVKNGVCPSASKLLLRRRPYSRCYQNGRCLADTERREKAC